MRIDSNQGARLIPESDRIRPQSPGNSGPGPAANGSLLGDDQAQLSGSHAQVQALTAQALQFPEVRQEKVNALRQSVLDGTYQPGSEQVAEAVFAHLLVAPAA